jgi:hypothetical protein
MKWSPALALFSRVIVLLALTADFTFAQKITTFDVPDGIATTPTAITPWGQIVGYYADTKAEAVRGFLRNRDGTVTTFAAPDSTFTVAALFCSPVSCGIPTARLPHLIFLKRRTCTPKA